MSADHDACLECGSRAACQRPSSPSCARRLTEADILARDHGDPACVMVWRFDEAPDVLRALSGHGGDEDWVALVPPDFGWVPWLDAFGGEIPLAGGWTVRIQAHA